MSKMDEMIVVAPRRNVFGERDEHAFQGTDTDVERINAILSGLTGHVSLMRRGDAEENPAFKQPIPYVAVTRLGAEGLELFVYERLQGAGETRLHHKLSVGVGGHMNTLFDADSLHRVIAEEAIRELEEELHIQGASDSIAIRICGLINDDGNEVGKVHLGLLAKVELPEGAIVAVREEEQLRGSWMTVEELRTPGVYDRLETWSQLAVLALDSHQFK